MSYILIGILLEYKIFIVIFLRVIIKKERRRRRRRRRKGGREGERERESFLSILFAIFPHFTEFSFINNRNLQNDKL